MKHAIIPPPSGSGGGDDMDGADALEDKIESMLSKIPPNWEVAEAHGKANLAYDPSKCTEPYDMKSDKFCHCCQHQIPTDEEFYPLDDNFILGELGEGFPILFQLMYYMNWLLFVLIIFFFIPAIALITMAVKKYGDKVTTEEPLSLYSFGAMLKFMDPDNLVVFGERQDYIIGYCVGLAFGICVTFIFIQVIRKKLNNDVDVVDKLSFTPSDFCVIGFCPEFSEECDYSIAGIKEEIVKLFKEKYEIDDVEYVNVAYDIENIFELHN